ncbi:hypothetical protein [Candidatus Regiella insecticola]|uniref:Uncharacterized protein n=1 Tax=Candidatus Regiella insecticola TaxID=138073 RepID=A0A6L2ZMW1_9ENTR|nr:hypothetical protein [Candidatus Regiella insecticola]GFN46163.1 uncharacterized protein RINTU1_16090 [Candidatus Regiella insecticola]
MPESDFYFIPEIQFETEIVKYASQVCPLAFACLVSIMEGTAYPDRDPIGALLEESSKPESAKGVEAHFQINKQGNHTAIPEAFIKLMPAIDRETVVSALRMTEVAIWLDSNLATSMYKKFYDIH